MTRIGSLFSGAGGLDLAVEAVFGGRTVWHSELDPAASKVLAHRWPNVPNLGDITAVDWDQVEPVDVLCGGFPCQDVSAAGKRAGLAEGTRSGLWAMFADAVDALRPDYVVIENVRGLLSAPAYRNVESDDATVGDGSGGPVLRAAGAVLGDLADLGYDAQWATVAAASVGAPHRRERVFIVAAAADLSSDRPVTLLPTPNAQDGNGGRYSSEGHQSTLPGEVRLLPTPRTTDGNGAGQHGTGGADLRTEMALLCTPSASDGAGGKTSRSGGRIDEPLLGGQAREMSTAWGKYEPAIRRWEQIAGPAPAPTEPNKNGNPRLSAAFSEWMMGWPAGWVTDPAIGITRNDQLRIIGNGVVPQQAVAALRWLLRVAEVAA